MNLDEMKTVSAKQKSAEGQYKHVIAVCVAAGCLSCHSNLVKAALEAEVKSRGLEKDVLIKGVGCLGLCTVGPLLQVRPSGKMFEAVTEADAGTILDSLDKDVPTQIDCDANAPFFTRQVKIALENCGVIDPEKIDDYIAHDGYSALLKVINDMDPLEVIDEISTSGLRGRGGAGFPTGRKWALMAHETRSPKYVICNGDEGDPGAFMDRSMLESDPHRILEGMAIAAYAMGASKGFVYVRAEYPLAIKRLRTAIRQAERMGMLGKNIGGSDFSFSVDIRLGAGAFVCGEETALIASIEGRRGMPKPRPPYPAVKGLWGQPTCINNVETLASIAPIIRNGGEWYSMIGTPSSKGTKVFALAGRVQNTGLIEVPMGMTIREIIFDIGGGIPDGRSFKAVQTGGPSGGCIPAEHLDLPCDYESLKKVGSIMGSGGMIVMDDTSCMVDVAKFFMEFCQSESCGKCIPCRTGTYQLLRLLNKITDGDGTMEDIALIEEICEVVTTTSLCGLGQTAPNPVLSTLRYFRDEFVAHIVEKRCPAGVCSMAHAKKLQEVK
ncbi:MAG: NuoF family protein [Armatimonadota bacterium]